jgi:integrase
VSARDERGRPTRWKAIALYRGFDGVTRPVERWGRSKAAAESNLRTALAERSRLSRGPDLCAVDRFTKAADLWLKSIVALVESGARSPGTVETYERHLRRHVIPALGGVRLGEVTPQLVDRFLIQLRTSTGTPTARSCRSVVSGILGLAVRYGAMSTNPVRDVGRLEGKPRKEPRALTNAERVALFAALSADPYAVAMDIPDLARFMLATGQRIGECLAVLWMEADLDNAKVDVTSTVIRVKGQGLIRKTTKSRAGQRTLILPSWAVADLRRRRARGVLLDQPIYSDTRGGLRDPNNTRRALRRALDDAGFQWVTSHNFRKTTATLLDEAGLSARVIADQLGHARPSMTQDVYMGRKSVDSRASHALESALEPLSQKK